jgi:hypothetical protein
MLRPLLKGDNTAKPFIAEGTVFLLNTRVGGSVECQSCVAFLKEKGDALVLAAAQITENLVLGPGFLAHGRVDLGRLTLGGNCNMVDFVEAEKITSLDFRFAKVTTIEHVPNSWPQSGRLLLDGLKYKNVFIGPPFHGNCKNLLEWLRLQPTEHWTLQPFEQLAKVLKASGYESQATEVFIAKQDDLRRYGDLRRGAKLWNLLIGFSIGHGYRSHRALLGLLGFLLIGTVFFQCGFWGHLITPNYSVRVDRKSTNDYPKFQAFVYSLDTLLPIVDLKQKGYWLPNANQGANVIRGIRFRWGGLLRIYLWVHILFGWV